MTGLKEAYPPGCSSGTIATRSARARPSGGEYYNLHDMAWRDSDGYCYFVGRNDDVIKCSGYRIGPFEVESALIEHPAVVECAVTAAPIPFEESGEGHHRSREGMGAFRRVGERAAKP